MKKAYSIPAALLLVAAMAACTENMEPDTQPQPGKQITMTATTSQPQTRLAFDDQLTEGNQGLVALAWKEGDTFVVYPAGIPSTLEKFTLSGAGGTTTGTFTGTLPDSNRNSWYAYYPNLYNNWTTQQQTGNANMEHLTDYYQMYGQVIPTGDKYSINFGHNTALMKFALTLPASLAGNEELKSLTLSTDQADWLYTTSQYGRPPVTGNSLTLGLNEVTPAAGNAITAYMALWPRDHLDAGTTLTITLETNQRTHTFQHTFSQQMDYTPGYAYTVTIGAGDWTTLLKMQFTVRATADLNTFQLPIEIYSPTRDYTLTVDWGDGSAPETIAPNTAARDAALKHQYESPGDYTITLRSDAQVGSEQMPRWCFDDYPTVAPMLVSMDTPMLKVGSVSLGYCFQKCSNLNKIHADLFDNNTQVTDFTLCFSGCSSLAAVPEGLFANNKAVTNFSYCFASCTRLVLNPNIFCMEADKTESTRFDRITSETINFQSCFYNVGTDLAAGEGGEAPALWSYKYKDGVTVNSRGCFYNCTKITNADDIPDGWKQ